MSIEDFNMQTFLRALTGGVQDSEYIRFRDIEVDFDGKDMSQEIAVEVVVGHQSDTVYMEVEFEGEHEIDVTLSHAQILERLDDDDEVALFTGSVLGELDHEQAIQAVHAIAAWRMSLTAGGDNENSISQHRRWEHIHTAITRMEVPEPEPEPTPADTEPAEKVIEIEVPVTEEALDRAPTVESAPVPDTETVSSNVKETVKSILSVEDDRLLLIGLLVEAGYAVGKKVS